MTIGPKDLAAHHPNSLHILKMLEPNTRLTGTAARVALIIYETAGLVLLECGDGPELTVGLRKLLEAKDCFVRQTVLVDGNK